MICSRSQSSDRSAFAEQFGSARRLAELALPFPAEFWIANSGSRVQGRVCASLSPVHAGVGYVGLFEADDAKTAAALLAGAEQWLRAQGAKTLYGPVAFNTWFSYRLRTSTAGDVDSPNFIWEPSNPPEYPGYFEAAGMQPAELYRSWALPSVEGMMNKLRPDSANAEKHGYSFRVFDGPNLLEREVPILHGISMESFGDNFLFEPIPLAMFRELYVPIAAKADVSLSYFLLDPQGKEVGFTFNFENQDHVILKSIALSPEARGKGLSNALLFRALQEAALRGKRPTVVALVRKGIQSESYSRGETPLWEHEYTLYRKDLT